MSGDKLIMDCRVTLTSGSRLENRILRALRGYSAQFRLFKPRAEIIERGILTVWGTEWRLTTPATAENKENLMLLHKLKVRSLV